ncbi:hypothetical protein SAMN06265222_105102 [Neorhodopirellula lusitana]|uniref:Uncharacterized protein n=2 Tax=Neorhodopirellula lusitana TaxID=445327 RepID=A0ABY1Q1I1_9BACT|nr:hypothetical protein SAMN06265222_105102 [Neorhodopirellula lusitana]
MHSGEALTSLGSGAVGGVRTFCEFENLFFNSWPLNMNLRQPLSFFFACLFLGMTLTLTGCGSEEPKLVTDGMSDEELQTRDDQTIANSQPHDDN